MRYVWLLTPIAHMCSIWLVVLVAANRYWAVCRPHASARVWTTRRTVGYVTAVVVGVIAFNVPRMFEYRVEEVAVSRSTTSAAVTALPAIATTSSPINHHYYYSTTHIETETNVESESGVTAAVEWTLRETRTAFGVSAFYRYFYKVLFVNILLVLLPLVTLIVLSVFVIRALRQTPSYQLSLLHARPRLCDKQVPVSPPPAAATAAAAAAAVADSSTDEVIKDDDVVVDSEGQGPQQQQQQQLITTAATINGDPCNITAECDEDEKTTRSRSKFSIISLKVCLPAVDDDHFLSIYAPVCLS